MKKIFSIKKSIFGLLIFLITLYLESCSPGFFSEDELSQIKYHDRKTNSIVLYKKSFNILNENEMEINTHYLLKAGDNRKTLPAYLHVYDGTILKLTKFAAKVIKKDGSTTAFGKSDLYVQNLSSSRQISDNYVKFLPVDKYVDTGDLIEMIYSYKTELAPLGMDFSLSETADNAENISCTITVPKDRKLLYKVVNDTISPQIIKDKDSEIYIFIWHEYSKDNNSFNPMGKKNDAPGLFAVSFPADKPSVSWVNFGNWYLNLISPKLNANEALKNKAIEVTKTFASGKEKVDAILNYVQKNVRYEQVYLPKGEIIPNNPELVLSRGYGDCKDYSILIYALAKSIGLEPDLVLCYRGRGNEFYPDIPVTQFNHMIVHYKFDGTDYWYDGTNRIGIPGITTNDLINQDALVLAKDRSKLIKIKESNKNLFSVNGILESVENDLKGKITLGFYDQFSIDLSFAEYYLSKSDLKDYLVKYIRNTLNENIVVNNLKWKSEERLFKVEFECDIPNSTIKLNKYTYTSLSKIFPSLLPSDTSLFNSKKLFYFPDYNKVDLNVAIENFTDPNSSKTTPYQIKYSYSLPAGPFDDIERISFKNSIKTILTEFTRMNKLTRSKGL